MDNVINNSDMSEDEMVVAIKEEVDNINELGDSVTKLLKHCKIQFTLGVILMFAMANNVWGFSVLGLWMLTFLVASHKYNNRKNSILWYWVSINYFKENGMLTDKNKHRIEDFTYNPLPFDK